MQFKQADKLGYIYLGSENEQFMDHGFYDFIKANHSVKMLPLGICIELIGSEHHVLPPSVLLP